MIRFNVPYVAGTEDKYIEQVLASKVFAGNGPFTKRVHGFLESRYGVPHVLLTHSCTAALEMSALILDLGPGDEVIMPSYTFATTASAFLRSGARPVFCEVDPATMNIDVNDAAARITDRTRAIVPVHYGGIGAPMLDLMDLVRARGLDLIEDAAQGLDAKYDGHWLGTLGLMGALSFHETKNIHCGLGGALFLNNPELFDRAEDIWERGTDRGKLFKGLVDKYSWVELGSSFYPSELQAAFLLAQLESLNSNIAVRRAVHETYMARLRHGADSGLFALPEIDAKCGINYHSLFLLCHSPQSCDGLRDHLTRRDIQAFIGYVPLHSSRMGQKLGYRGADLPITEEFAQRVLRLPFHHELTQQDVHRVADEIAAFFQHD